VHAPPQMAWTCSADVGAVSIEKEEKMFKSLKQTIHVHVGTSEEVDISFQGN
jgi:hypothetical protein